VAAAQKPFAQVHPVSHTVPADAVTLGPAASHEFQPEPDRQATKLNLYRKN